MKDKPTLAMASILTISDRETVEKWMAKQSAAEMRR